MYDNKNNKYLFDVIKYQGNIVIYLLFINKIHEIFHIVDVLIMLETNQMIKKTLKFDLNSHLGKIFKKENIKYSYNMFIYLKIIKKRFEIEDDDIIVKEINKFLKDKDDEVYKMFIDDIKEFIEILININRKYSNLANNIMVNFILRYFENNKYFIISKNKILTTLLESKPITEANQNKLDKIMNNYNDIYEGKYKLLTRNILAEYKGVKYPDCGEVTILNIFNYLLTHKDKVYNNKFRTELLPEGSEIRKYYEKLGTFENLYNEYIAKKKLKINFGNEFYNLFTEKEGIQYNKLTCDIVPTLSNTLNICNMLMLKTEEDRFKTFEDFIKHFDLSHEIILKNLNGTNIIDINNELKITFSLHSLIEYKGGNTDINDVYFVDNEETIFKLFNDMQPTITNIKELNNCNKLLIYSVNYRFIEEIAEVQTELIKIICVKYRIGIKKTDYEDKSFIPYLILFSRVNPLLKDIVNELIQKEYVDLNENCGNNMRIINLLIQFEHIDILRYILTRFPIDLDYFDDDGNTPLMCVLLRILKYNSDFYDILDLIIDKMENINKRNNKGNTALILSIKIGLRDFTNKLLKKNADINIQNEDGDTALLIDITKSFILEPEIYKNKQINFNITNEDGNHALILALKNNINNLTLNALINKSDINIQNKDGNNSLMVAILTNNIFGVEKILEKNPIIDAKNKEGYTALMYAIMYRENLVEKVLEKNPNLNIKNDNGNTALMIAIERNKENIVDKLIEKNADINILNNDDNNALILALKNNINNLTLNTLINKSNINIQNKDGHNSLMVSIINNNIFGAEKILEKNPNIDAKDKYNNTALMHAILYMQNIIEKILEKNPDLNIQNDNGYTALMLAIERNKEDIIDKLLEKNVDVDLKNIDGKTALMIAIDIDRENIIKKILKKIQKK